MALTSLLEAMAQQHSAAQLEAIQAALKKGLDTFAQAGAGDRVTIKDVQLRGRDFVAATVQLGPVHMSVVTRQPIVAMGTIFACQFPIWDHAQAFFSTTASGVAKSGLLGEALRPLEVRFSLTRTHGPPVPGLSDASAFTRMFPPGPELNNGVG
jgi:hypothetical protein